MVATRGSTSPFFIEAGLVIFNRTSGSTSPNNTNAVTVTVTATTTESVSNPSSVRNTSSLASNREAATGAGVGVPLGLALLVTLGLLWRQIKHAQSLKNDVQTWESRYGELIRTKTSDFSGVEQRPQHRFVGQGSNEVAGQPRIAHQLESWRPGEIDGTQVDGTESRTEQV
ncbi:MAG: hypothetical protein ALECFALPRED_006213 [Alectoria fallacina]|uniref:Uncharacterized protein n=1 Tax=Alectoria fallacina TaxID=1903189 RepID=A0A8H3G1N0_9LECA|nr:MAG: hypothetical protein ALECFALPRED_006213 [Alectoria fallacina]